MDLLQVCLSAVRRCVLTCVGPTEREAEPVSAPSPSSAIPSESPTNKILRLLKVVHELTVEARGVSSRNDQMDETLFVNNKLTAKLTRQLEEVMILARYVTNIACDQG